MATRKLRVGVLFGGRSGEHEVSLLSAASVLNAIDHSKYDVVPIGRVDIDSRRRPHVRRALAANAGRQQQLEPG